MAGLISQMNMRIIKVIKDNPALSQSQIAEMFGDKQDTIKLVGYKIKRCYLNQMLTEV